VEIFGFFFQQFAPIGVHLRFRIALHPTTEHALATITQEGDSRFSTFVEMRKIRSSFSTRADSGDQQLVAGREESTTAQHVAWNDHESRGSGGGILHKVSS